MARAVSAASAVSVFGGFSAISALPSIPGSISASNMAWRSTALAQGGVSNTNFCPGSLGNCACAPWRSKPSPNKLSTTPVQALAASSCGGMTKSSRLGKITRALLGHAPCTIICTATASRSARPANKRPALFFIMTPIPLSKPTVSCFFACALSSQQAAPIINPISY